MGFGYVHAPAGAPPGAVVRGGIHSKLYRRHEVKRVIIPDNGAAPVKGV